MEGDPGVRLVFANNISEAKYLIVEVPEDLLAEIKKPDSEYVIKAFKPETTNQ